MRDAPIAVSVREAKSSSGIVEVIPREWIWKQKKI
jgi:hypothetical protein